MLGQHFVTNLSFFAFTTTPEKFSPGLMLILENQLESMLLRRTAPRVWN